MVSGNIDSVAIAQYLHRDPAARDVIVSQAAAMLADSTRQEANLASVRAQVDALRLPMGWPAGPDFEWWRSLLGWAITVLAISLGAPFWFDTLNRIVVIRSTVKPHEKSPEEGSEDRQDRARVSQVPKAPSWAPLPTNVGGVPATAPPPGAGTAASPHP